MFVLLKLASLRKFWCVGLAPLDGRTKGSSNDGTHEDQTTSCVLLARLARLARLSPIQIGI